MRIGVSSYSYSRYIREGRMDLFGVILKAAEQGFEGIEFAGLGLKADDPGCAELAGRLKAACAGAGLPILSYDIPADFLRAKGGWRDEVKRLEKEIEIAVALGVPMMRHDVTSGFPDDHKGSKDFAAAVPILADGCRAVTEFAAGLGVRTILENHGFFVQESRRCEALIKAVDHKNYGALVDIGNFLCADEQPVSAVTRMAPYAFHAHAKDFHVKPAGTANPGRGWFTSRGGAYLRGAIIGHGEVDVPACLAALRHGGYDGWLTIEFEGLEDNALGLEVGLENLRRYLTT